MSIMAKTPSGYKKIGSAYLGERPVDKVFNANGDVVYALQRELTGVPPLLFKGKEQSELLNYRIYGDTVDGESVGDRTANLFDAFIQGIGLNISTGLEEINNTSYTSGFIGVENDKLYSYSGGSDTTSIAFFAYDSSENYIGRSTNMPRTDTIIYTSTTFSNYTSFSTNLTGNTNPIAYIRIIHMNAEQTVIDDEQIMLNSGSTALPYEPYGYKVPVTVEGKNLFDERNGDVTDTYIQDNGTININPDGDKYICNRINVLPNNTYTFSWGKMVLGTNDYPPYIRVAQYDSNGNFISRILVMCSNFPNKSYTVTTGNDVSLWDIRIDDASSRRGQYLEEVMLNSGSEPLSYEPYHAPVTTPIYLPEPIKMVGDEAEYIDYAEQKLHRVRKNLLQNTATSRTINGVTFTVNADGSITCSGILTSGEFADLFISGVFLSDTDILENGNYVVSCANGSNNASLLVGNSGGEVGRVRAAEINISANLTWAMLRIRQADPAITLYPMIRKASIEDDTYEPYIENTDLDVTLPTLPTLTGTNVLSVGTEVQPSRMDIKGRIKSLT